MTREETLKVLSVLNAYYPNDFKHTLGKTEEAKRTRNAVTNIWVKQFENNTYEEVSNAIHVHIANDAYGKAPTIGNIKSYLQKTQNVYMTPIEAWNILSNAVCHSSNMEEAYERLPREIQVCVTPEQMYTWAFETDSKTFETVISSNFQRSFSAKQQYMSQMDNVPDVVKISLRGEKMKKLDSRQEEIKYLERFKEVLEKC